jgi:hypothetical protein
MKTTLLLLSLLLFKTIYSQELIGQSEEQIYAYLKTKGIVKEKVETGKRPDDDARWLSYSEGTVKYMCVFDKSSNCVYLRIVYPNSYLSQVQKSLKESRYTALSDSSWQYQSNNNTYHIYLIKDEKYFMVDKSPEKTP